MQRIVRELSYSFSKFWKTLSPVFPVLQLVMYGLPTNSGEGGGEGCIDFIVIGFSVGADVQYAERDSDQE